MTGFIGWLTRLIPSRAAVWAALTGGALFIAAWLRRDARKDARTQTKTQDLENAQDIHTRVDRDRADPDRLRPFDDAGYRD